MSFSSGPARDYRIVYDAESEAAHALGEYLGDNLKSGETAFTLRASGKFELAAEKLGRIGSLTSDRHEVKKMNFSENSSEFVTISDNRMCYGCWKRTPAIGRQM
jgi:hypothetical protein